MTQIILIPWHWSRMRLYQPDWLQAREPYKPREPREPPQTGGVTMAPGKIYDRVLLANATLAKIAGDTTEPIDQRIKALENIQRELATTIARLQSIQASSEYQQRTPLF